jgi:hypothetical protein
MFTQLESVRNATGSLIVADGKQSGVQLCRWVYAQHHNYSMKYATSKSDYSIKIGRMMTFAREAKLKSIGFQFTALREDGINQSKWMDKFLQAKRFYDANGHCMIMPSHDVPSDLVSYHLQSATLGLMIVRLRSTLLITLSSSHHQENFQQLQQYP